MVKKKDYTFLIIICVILFSILGLLYLENESDNVKEDEIKVKYYLLNDYSRFFTVNSCIYKYFSYLSSKDIDSLLKILDYKYIEDNKIDKNNIFDYLPNIDSYYSFVSKKMYYQKINDNYFSYYVYGYAEEDINSGIGNKSYYYFKVDLDQENSTFSITPIDSNLFEEVSNG